MIIGMENNDLLEGMLAEIDQALLEVIARLDKPDQATHHEMLAYHLGFDPATGGKVATGKRIRPLLVTLTSAAAGGSWKAALPAAAAVELTHNFSLIHDDIQDKSPVRRGRPALWTKWGIAQAINAGDTMFSLAHLAILNLREHLPAETVLHAALLLQETCLRLTQGQYLDLSYEEKGDIHLNAYWLMVEGKTAALLSTCCELGALIANAPPDIRAAYAKFGTLLGLAFQAKDDLLGIWGDVERTGKSNQSDLVQGKKSLPILFGIDLKGAFAERWAEGRISPGDVTAIAELLEAEGARVYTQEKVDQFTEQALSALQAAQPQGPAAQALAALAKRLLKRTT